MVSEGVLAMESTVFDVVSCEVVGVGMLGLSWGVSFSCFVDQTNVLPLYPGHGYCLRAQFWHSGLLSSHLSYNASAMAYIELEKT